ncbi:SOS-response repressor and protease LexA [Liberibacter crescens BT-1]|uniref:LexA repressor n=1 Tax=Liberibacter crescens (strain BT-1) TaxID=1215343 RepID=L0EU74_LIBCB|nr:transcriptional repressor LexA [Liberibacter crescens]AGA65089.1 SOS-response repressor and protease LexA [Liberibacter crescens BT-1]AMC13073.1 LexA family transcriptional regulator [Liberibacter crescens]
MLTRKQQELLLFIHGRIRQTGVSPSFDEMKDALRLVSKASIHRLIIALEERGFIRRLPKRARALEILRLPDDLMSNTKVGNNFSYHSAEGLSRKQNMGFSSVPFMGHIAAEVPISNIQNNTHEIMIPINMFQILGNHYALEVEGDSMNGVGILDSDTVIICSCETANSGDVVVALLNEEKATLRRFRRKGDSIALEAANPAYKTRIFPPKNVKIQGKLVGLIRRY